MKIIDATPIGTQLQAFEFVQLNERMSVREVIRARIYQEVTDWNQSQSLEFSGLVQPTDTENTLNGYKLKKRRTINWKEQYTRALDAFGRNGFFILIGDRQVEDLDEIYDVGPETEISFVKLMPLVGG